MKITKKLRDKIKHRIERFEYYNTIITINLDKKYFKDMFVKIENLRLYPNKNLILTDVIIGHTNESYIPGLVKVKRYKKCEYDFDAFKSDRNFKMNFGDLLNEKY